MKVGKIPTQSYNLYKFFKTGYESTFQTLKKKFNLQITVEGETKEKVYLNSNAILVVKEKDDAYYYREYKKTDKGIESVSLQAIQKRKDMKEAVVTENVLYDEKKLYSIY